MRHLQRVSKLPRAAGLLTTLAVLLTVSGCQSMLNRSVYLQSIHMEPVSQEDPTGVVDISNYSSLLNTLRSWVSGGQTDGILRFSNYAGTMEDDLGRAFEEVMYNDAYGRYVEPLLIYLPSSESNSLFTVRISYSAGRSETELKSIRKISGLAALTSLLQEALRTFNGFLLVEIPYYDESDDFIHNTLKEYYYQNPLYAMGMPDITVAKYQGKKTTTCLLEVRLAFTGDSETLLLRHELNERIITQWSSELTQEQTSPEALLSIYDMIGEKLSPIEPDTEKITQSLWETLTDKKAASEGYALAFKALADEWKIPCRIVRGTWRGTEHCWILAELDGQWYHIDAAADDAADTPNYDMFLRTDDEMPKEYQWIRDDYPAAEGDIWSRETILYGEQADPLAPPAQFGDDTADAEAANTDQPEDSAEPEPEPSNETSSGDDESNNALP